MTELRVLHVAQPVDGGVARVVVGLATWQHAQGLACSVACPDGWLSDELTAAGVPVHRWLASRAPGPTALREVAALRRIVAGISPDVVHLHSSKAGLAGRLALRGRIPTLFQPHAWAWQAVPGVVGRLSGRWERRAAQWADRVVCVSNDERAEGQRHGIVARYTVVPNGVELTAFPVADAQQRAAARGVLGVESSPLVVCVGRLVARKGQDVLIRAMRQVQAHLPGACLALVGDGPDRAALEALCREQGLDAAVRLVGGSLDTQSWYAAADVVAVPSRGGEGMALTPLEAMATGRAVVVSDVEGMRESVPAEAGAIVAPGAVDALAAALLLRLTDPARARREGEAGRRHVERAHDARLTWQRLTVLAAQVAQGQPAR